MATLYVPYYIYVLFIFLHLDTTIFDYIFKMIPHYHIYSLMLKFGLLQAYFACIYIYQNNVGIVLLIFVLASHSIDNLKTPIIAIPDNNIKINSFIFLLIFAMSTPKGK